MNVKTYLNQGFHLNQLIEVNKGELHRLRELSVSINSPDLSSERIQSSGHSDRVGNIIAKIVDFEREIQRDIDRYVSIQREIRRLVYQVEDDRLKAILQKRYINFEKWEQIADDMSIELRWLFRLHNQALKEAAKKNQTE